MGIQLTLLIKGTNEEYKSGDHLIVQAQLANSSNKPLAVSIEAVLKSASVFFPTITRRLDARLDANSNLTLPLLDENIDARFATDYYTVYASAVDEAGGESRDEKTIRVKTQSSLNG